MTDIQEWRYRVVPKTLALIVGMAAMAFLLPQVPR